MQAIINNLLTSYEKAGKGKPIVLLHGWGDSSKTFDSLSQKLAKDYEVITLDLPGFGSSQAPKTAWDLTDYANFVSEFLKKIDVRPYALLGHSNGGAISLRGVSRGILPTEKLVLLASSGIRGQFNPRKKALRLVSKTAKLATMPLPRRWRQKIKKRAYQKIGSDMFIAEHLQESFKRIVTDDVQEDARKIHCPTLLIYGELDKATPISYGKTFTKLIPNSRLKIIKNSEHFVHLEKSDEVLALVRDFLKGES